MTAAAAYPAQSWASAVSLREARESALVTTRQMVHEGVHALRAMPETMRPKQPGSCWPQHLYERDDHGLYEETYRWRPTPTQIDWAFKVAVWYGLWRGRDRKRNGLARYEWALLEVRGWQVMFGRESWRDLADIMNQRPNMPTMSYEGWRRQHAQLIEIALNQAIKAHDIKVAG